ncbi:MAG TPA: hypothetical protein VF669_11985 [Tepidisphaeraceae bacterium]|jgi:hypothetical protein
MKLLIVLGLCLAATTGCASYTTPGGAANLHDFGASPKTQAQQGDAWITSEMNRKPLASFPASVAVARVQAPGYTSYSAPTTWGSGAFTVVTSRDVETPQEMQRLEKMPQLRGIAPLNHLVIPPRLQSDEDLRQAAAKLRADILLVYTLDTCFEEKDRSTPLSVITLGATPTAQMHVACTASAALLDTRSGYIYGLSETTERRDAPRNAWTTEMEIDRFRVATEQAAFNKLVGEIQRTWSGIVREHATAAADPRRYETEGQ